MQKIILIIIMLCTLSTQVLGTISHGDEHSSLGDIHSFMHEIDQPHSHDHEDEDGLGFTLSYSQEAIEHINEDIESYVVGLLEMSSANVTWAKPFNTINRYAINWSSPFLQYSKPPPKH
jgi:hypothetical protein